MKLSYVMLVGCFFVGSYNLFAQRLKNEILSSIDGIPGLLDRDKIHKSIFTGKMLKIFMDGGNPKSIKMDHIEFEGKRYPLKDLLTHTFQGQKYSLKELADLEDRTIKPADKAVLKEVLNKLREKFNILMSLNLQEALGTKRMVLPLIKESCKVRNRPDSILIKWGEVKEGMEYDSLKQNVTSIRIFYTFCTDLIYFLKDIVDSCPVAFAQWQKWMQQQNKA